MTSCLVQLDKHPLGTRISTSGSPWSVSLAPLWTHRNRGNQSRVRVAVHADVAMGEVIRPSSGLASGTGTCLRGEYRSGRHPDADAGRFGGTSYSLSRSPIRAAETVWSSHDRSPNTRVIHLVSACISPGAGSVRG